SDDDAGCPLLDVSVLLGDDRSLSVERIPEGVDHPSHEALSDRDLGDPAGPLYYVAFLDLRVIAKDDSAYIVFLEVQDHADDVVGKFDKLPRHRIFKAVN